MSERRRPEPGGTYVQTLTTGGLRFVSGQVPVDPDGHQFSGDDLVAQAEQVFSNLEACLAGEGLALTDVASMTTYLRDIADAAEVSAVHSRFLGDHRLTSTVVQVSGLLNPEWRLEIQAVAVAQKPNQRWGRM